MSSTYDFPSDREIQPTTAAQPTLNKRLGIGLLWTVHSALDEALGDSDVTHIEDDAELRERHPVQWAAQRLAEAISLLEDASQPSPAATVERPKCELCGLEDGACICAHLRPRLSAGNGGDPTAGGQWNDGCDFSMTQLCIFLGVDQNDVRWDAATETVDGDVQAVIGNILRAKFGEDWGPDVTPTEPQAASLPATHEFVPSKHSQFCDVCGYSRNERLKHPQRVTPPVSRPQEK